MTGDWPGSNQTDFTMATFTGNDSWAWADRDAIDGTIQSDTFDLRAGDDSAWGDAGNDTMFGGYGDDSLSGEDGNDQLQGGYGDDRMEGNAGVDTLVGGSGDDLLYGDGSLANSALDRMDTLYGGDGRDTLYGGAGADRLYGGRGDDVIDLGSGSLMTGDIVDGGQGIDRVSIGYKPAGSGISFVARDFGLDYPAPGGFTLRGIEQFHVRGSDFGDALTGWIHDDSLQGGYGRDTLTGLGGDDSLHGGADSDTLLGGRGDDRIYGDQTGYYDWNEPTGAAGHDVIYAGFGNDAAEGDGGNDSIYGEQGNDDLSGGEGNDVLSGAQGRDVLKGGLGSDTMYGGAGDDELYSTWWLSHDQDSDRDFLDGGNGNDEIWMGVRDIAIGGNQAGTVDTVRMAFGDLPAGHALRAVGVTYNLLTQGQVRTILANGSEVEGFEVLDFYGGAGRDVITGGNLADWLDGGEGNDSLTGGNGNDVLDGADGNDVVAGGNGHDLFHDSDGASAPRNDTAYGGAGNDTFNDGRGADLFYGGDNDDQFLLGSFLRDEDYLADTIFGGTGWDKVSYLDADSGVFIDLASQWLNAGAALGDRIFEVEQIIGSSRDDVIYGDAAANFLDGGAHDDVLHGRAGRDTIRGGGGADELAGGSDADTFILEYDDSWFDHATYWPHDRIVDFTRGSDKLMVLAEDFGVTAANFRLLNQTWSTAAGTGPAFVYETDARRLWFDADGAGVDTDGDGAIDTDLDPILIASLDGITGLSVNDFTFL